MFLKMPYNGWGQIKPRAWQAEELPKVIAHYAQPSCDSALGRAVTGAGKAKFLAQVVACANLSKKECIVVSTSNIQLVEQLEETIRERIEPGFMSGASKIGTYYTHGKDVHTPVIVTCTPSVPALAAALKATERTCGLWIADECHRVQCATILEAHATLNPLKTLGLTATPFRAKEEERLFLFKQKLFDYGPAEALRDGCVVRLKPDFWTGGEADLDSACLSMTEGAAGPGIFNAVSICDAEVFVKRLTDAGRKAMAIHSKMPKGERKARLKLLEAGELSCLVHVSLLQEGVDLPWLRWLCMRRPVSSRVRFIQEVGRILRAILDANGVPVVHPQWGVKELATLYDPHGLYDSFNLTYDAVLGGEAAPDDPDSDDTLSEAEKKKRVLEQMIFELMHEIVMANAGKKPLSMIPLAGYLREVAGVFDLCGLIERKVLSRDWRNKPSTDKQRAAVPKMGWTIDKLRCIPKVHRKPLQTLMTQVPAMTRGLASDLLSIQHALADNKKWPDLGLLDKAAEEGVAAHQKFKLASAPAKPEAVKVTGATKKEIEAAMPGLFDDE